jgi:hypothetical protein
MLCREPVGLRSANQFEETKGCACIMGAIKSFDNQRWSLKNGALILGLVSTQRPTWDKHFVLLRSLLSEKALARDL